MFFLFLRKQLQKSKNIYPFFTEKSPPVLNGGGIRSGGKPTSGDGKVIRIINADEQHIKERVLLNLKTSQPFEEVLRDLGNYNFYIVLIALFKLKLSARDLGETVELGPLLCTTDLFKNKSVAYDLLISAFL